MQNGYHTAKVEWIKDEPIPEEELGNYLDMEFSTCSIKFIANIQIILSNEYTLGNELYKPEKRKSHTKVLIYENLYR